MIFRDVSFSVTEKSLLYIPANTEYTRQSYDKEEIIAIHFNILNKELCKPSLIEINEAACNEFFYKIYALWVEKGSGFKYKCAAAFYEYLSTIILEKRYSQEYDKLEASIHYIESNLSQKIRVCDLAKMCNLCETQYRKLFTKEFGISPIKYINNLRINNAISKISSGYYSMSEISELCGFSDQKYFNKIFKTETGKSPTQYKKQYLYNAERS